MSKTAIAAPPGGTDGSEPRPHLTWLDDLAAAAIERNDIRAPISAIATPERIRALIAVVRAAEEAADPNAAIQRTGSVSKLRAALDALRSVR